MSKIDEIRKRHEDRKQQLARLGPIAQYEATAEQAHLDRATLLAALDGEWQSERPEAGDWWLSLHTEKRIGLFDDKQPLRVVIDAGGDVIEELRRVSAPVDDARGWY